MILTYDFKICINFFVSGTYTKKKHDVIIFIIKLIETLSRVFGFRLIATKIVHSKYYFKRIKDKEEIHLLVMPSETEFSFIVV